MKNFRSICVLVALLCATSAQAFDFTFDDTEVIVVSSEVSPRIPFWQSAEVEDGDIFSQYCVDFLRSTGLNRYYSQRECFDSIKAVNGYTESQLHWIYPGQIVWLPSPQNVRLGQIAGGESFVDVEQLREQLGLDELEARIDALPDEARVNEIVSESTEEVVDNVLPGLVTDEVERQLAEVQPVVPPESEDRTYVPWWVYWFLAILLAGLAVLAFVSWKRDKKTRQTANNARVRVDGAEKNIKALDAKVKKAATQDELDKVSKNLGAVDKRVSLAQEAADEAGELAASAMALLRFGDFKVVKGYPTQTAVDRLKADEKIVVTLAHIDNEEDVREIHFTCVANAFNDDRDGLKIDGITNQRRPIAKQLRSMASAIANGARSNHLQGVESEETKAQQKSQKTG